MHKRRVTYRMYPSKQQMVAMDSMRGLHQQLYNACLQERISAYKKEKKSISYVDQAKSITLIRSEHPEYEAINAQSLQVTAKRLDLAFQHFFRRVRKGEVKCGFPRFKSKHRYPGFGYKTHGDGWKFVSDGTHHTLRLSGVGLMRIRGKSRNEGGQPKTLEVMYKQGKWYASIVFDVACVKRGRGKRAIGLDWGLEYFSTQVDSEGSVECIENPRHTRKALKKLLKAQRRLSKKKRGSKRRGKARSAVARLHAKVANQRKDFLHQTSARLVSQCGLIATEQLNIKAMTSHGGAHKKGLNREILSTSPGLFFEMLKYKAAEAGTLYLEAPTRTLKPSQRCHNCHVVRKKALSERVHWCDCGIICPRDVNSGALLVSWGLAQLAPEKCQELALRGGAAVGPLRLDSLPVKRETPSISPQAIGWM